MADSRYYWIKLRTDFFNQETIDFILSQKNGCEYIVLYQMLCLKTANNGGELSTAIGEMIVPYNIEKIVRDTKYFDFDTVSIALKLFQQLGLIYESDESGILRIANYDEMVGSASDTPGALRQKRFRDNQKKALLNVTESVTGNVTGNVTENVTKRNEDIRDKILDIRDERINNNNADFQSAIESEFELLWKAYPNKQGKANALKAYTKARKDKKHPVSFETVKYAVETYAKEMRDTETKYIKHGSTWFNQQCWCDYEAKREAEESIRNNPNIDPYSGGSTEF